MRETMKNIIYTLLTTCIVASCADVPEEYSNTETLEKPVSNNLQYVDIANAESLFISSSTGSGRTSSRGETTKNKLFKITEDGAVLEIEYKDSDNNSYTVTKQPISIDNVNAYYVVFSFGTDKINVTECYLANKSTGEVYLLGSSDHPMGIESNCPVPQGQSTEKMILTDNKNNFYYRYYAPVEGYYLRQVNYTDSDNITATQHIVGTESIDHFVVDSNGNIAYTASIGSKEVYRMRESDGRYSNLPYTQYWIGLDGNITSNEYITNQHYKFKLSNKLIAVRDGSDTPIVIDNGTEINTLNLPLSEISIAKSSSNYVYISGTDNSSDNTVIVKFNPNDNSFSQIYTDGTYNLYNFNVTSDDCIIFSALRMNDGKTVLGKIDKEGDLTITYESDNEKITILEIIN
tara:strand:+ start:12 stop:1223 length:1212 start_codon:yes stop_codon:yes gene_type:complete